MDTTTVLSMRSLTTLPVRIFLRLRTVVMACSVRTRLLGAALLLLQHREQTRHLAAALADLERVVQLLHRVAKAEVEQLLAQLRDAGADLIRAHVPDRLGLHAGRHVTPLPARCAR